MSILNNNFEQLFISWYFYRAACNSDTV